VDLAVEGELFAAGDRVRVIAKLVSVPDDVTIRNWTFDRRGKDILEIQTDLAAAIVNRLRLKLGGQLRYEIDPALQLKFWTARGLAERARQSNLTKAIGLFEEIVAEAPSYAPAWAGLAGALGLGVRLDAEVPPEALSRMEEAALQAHKLDPLLAEAHVALGVVQARELDWHEAERSFGNALSLNPSLTSIHNAAVLNLLLPLNRLDEAMELIAIAGNVDPSSLAVRRSLAHVQVDAGEYEEAIRNAQWVLQRDPAYPFTAIRLGRALALLGWLDEALRVFEEDRSGPAYVGYVYAVTGRRAEAEALATALAHNPAQQLLIYGGLGDKERAFEALERLVGRNPWRAATWMHRPEVAIIRDDPRFGEIRRRLRMPEQIIDGAGRP
jgi:tetratricopeptide (TPR) repeat protein